MINTQSHMHRLDLEMHLEAGLPCIPAHVVLNDKSHFSINGKSYEHLIFFKMCLNSTFCYSVSYLLFKNHSTVNTHTAMVSSDTSFPDSGNLPTNLIEIIQTPLVSHLSLDWTVSLLFTSFSSHSIPFLSTYIVYLPVGWKWIQFVIL